MVLGTRCLLPALSSSPLAPFAHSIQNTVPSLADFIHRDGYDRRRPNQAVRSVVQQDRTLIDSELDPAGRESAGLVVGRKSL